MTISVIIPTYNRSKDLKDALNSILIQTLLPKEVIVVDQSENTLTKELVESFDHANKSLGVRFIWYYQKEKGSAKARNVGFRLSSGDIISFTDDDVEFDKDYLEKVMNYFNSDPQIGGISGNNTKPLNPTKIKWMFRSALMRIFLVDFFDGKMTVSGLGCPLYAYEIDKVIPVELFAGYSINLRRRYFEENQFDEWFTGYSFREDVDVTYRISRVTKLIMVPDANFKHNLSTSGRLDYKKLKRMEFRNFYYVFMKYKYTGIISKLLFFYSIFGLVCIDFLDWVTSRFKEDKYWLFMADIEALFALAKGEYK